jgi:hypothetical protein
MSTSPWREAKWVYISYFYCLYLKHVPIFWEVVGLERGPLSLVNTIEELFEIKSSGSGLENRDYGRRDSSRWQRSTLYPQKLTLMSSTSSGRSVGIVRSRTQAMEFSSAMIKAVFIYSTQLLGSARGELIWGMTRSSEVVVAATF